MAHPQTVVRCGLLIVLSGALLLGCDDDAVDVPSGRFVATVDGAVTDTLTGRVHHRTEGGRLTGFELGPRDGPGLSIELEPRPLAPRTYEVIDRTLFGVSRKGAPPGAMAFLTTAHARFEAAVGTLRVEQVDGQTVAATFSFGMEGGTEGGGEGTAVRVVGRFRAPPARPQ